MLCYMRDEASAKIWNSQSIIDNVTIVFWNANEKNWEEVIWEDDEFTVIIL